MIGLQLKLLDSPSASIKFQSSVLSTMAQEKHNSEQNGSNTLHIGAAQVAEVHLDREATVEKDCEYIYKAGDLDLDLLVFPEFHIPSRPTWHRFADDIEFDEYYARLFNQAVTVPGPTTEKLADAAAEAGVAVVVGINEKEAGTAGTMYNSLLFINADGTVLGSRRKLVPTIDERMFHTGGTGEDMTTFDSSIGTLGGLMCGEHTNPLAKFTTIAQGEEIHAAAWPSFHYWDREKRESFISSVCKEHAIAGAVPVVVSTGVLTEKLAESVGISAPDTDSGTSSIIGPHGMYLAGPKWEGEGIVHAELDLEERTRAKAFHDPVGHYNRFDIFNLRVDRTPHEPVTFEETE